MSTTTTVKSTKPVKSTVSFTPRSKPAWLEKAEKYWNDRVTFALSEQNRNNCAALDNEAVAETYQILWSLANEISHRIRIHQDAHPGTLTEQTKTSDLIRSNLQLDISKPMGRKLTDSVTQEQYDEWCLSVQNLVPKLIEAIELINNLEKNLTVNKVRLCNYNKF